MSCTTPSARLVRFGDHERDVRAALGAPYKMSLDSMGRMTWLYLGLSEGDCTVIFRDNHVQQPPHCPEDGGYLSLDIQDRRNQSFKPRNFAAPGESLIDRKPADLPRPR